MIRCISLFDDIKKICIRDRIIIYFYKGVAEMASHLKKEHGITNDDNTKKVNAF